ncbi:MAG: MerR family transcriptional regulator, partial [Actinomycetes bacterium]
MPEPSSSRSAPAAEALEVGLGVAAVARRLGVAPGTLRTWARRYGIGPTSHVAGSQRRYTARDLARLTQMRALMLEGVSAADAARAAMEQPAAAPRRGLRRSRDRSREPAA